jgi:hypothetical protein
MASKPVKSCGGARRRRRRTTGTKTGLKKRKTGVRKRKTGVRKTGVKKTGVRRRVKRKLAMTKAPSVKRRRRRTRVKGGTEVSLAQLQKEARKLGIPLSKDGKKRTKISLARAINYRH